jgi:hypothetical protein
VTPIIVADNVPRLKEVTMAQSASGLTVFTAAFIAEYPELVLPVTSTVYVSRVFGRATVTTCFSRLLFIDRVGAER